MAQSFQGKVALITGSSMGIGKAIARQLAQQGAKVVLNARNAEKLARTEAGLQAEGLKVAAFAADVSNWDQVSNLIRFCEKTYGGLDILINNAGMATRGSVDAMAPEVFAKVSQVNLLGSIYPSKAALGLLRKSRGSVVFISTIASFHGLPYNSIYCASKKALSAFSESFRLEEKGNGVHVGIAYVGFTENDPEKIILDSNGKRMYLENRQGIKKQTPDQVAHIINQMVRKRKKKVTLSFSGKALSVANWLAPWLIDFIYTKNLPTIRANSEGEARYVK
ncbi:MAG: SDR family oxidoreductase [Bacteroidota bacterium]